MKEETEPLEDSVICFCHTPRERQRQDLDPGSLAHSASYLWTSGWRTHPVASPFFSLHDLECMCVQNGEAGQKALQTAA